MNVEVVELPWQRSVDQDLGKILLVYPNTGVDVFGVNVGLPLSCLYLGTVLEQAGYRVEILDERLSSSFEDDVAAAVEQERPILVGISSMTGMQIRGGLKAAGTVRAIDATLPIVWGGVHPSLCPDSTLNDDLCDIIVKGEGEITVVELADCIRGGGDLSQIAGVGFKRDGELVYGPYRPMIKDLDVIPRPNYGLLKLENYFTQGYASTDAQLQLVTSRGCPYDCEFCYNLEFNERRFRYHSAERVVDDITHVAEELGASALFIEDDYFFGHPRRVERICDLLLEKDLGLFIQVACRVDYLDKRTPEMLDKLYAAGFKELWIGIESGSDKRLKQIMKRNTVTQIRNVNRLLSKSSFYVKYGFMAGFPEEDRDETLDTVDFMFELIEENPAAGLAPVAIFTPYPGTGLYETARKLPGAKFPETLEGWSHFHFFANNNQFLSPRQRKFVSKINTISRFFDKSVFERLCENRLRTPLMFVCGLYYSYLRLRLRWRFFGFMPEVPVIKAFGWLYIRLFHRTQLRANR